MRSVSHQGLRVRRLASAEALGAVRPAWTALLDAVPEAGISATWEWTNAWWCNRDPEWELWVLAVEDADGRLRGVAPWARTEHALGPLRVKRLAFVGDHRAYRLRMDILARAEEKVAVTQTVLAYLAQHGQAWDVLDLEALAQGSPVAQVAASAGGLHFAPDPLLCPVTSLPPTWEQFERERLSSDYRWQLRNRRRKLEKAYPGQVQFWRVRDPGELPAAMAGLAELHQRRWHGKGQGSSFDHASFAGFHRDLSAEGLRRDWLRLYLIQIGEQVIAAEYAFLYRGTVSGYATAFDVAYADYNPGQLLLAYMVQDAIAEGARELDLGRGSYDYKFRWTDRQRIDLHLVLTHTLAGHAWGVAGAAARRAKVLARAHVPQALRDRINHGELLLRRPLRKT